MMILDITIDFMYYKCWFQISRPSVLATKGMILVQNSWFHAISCYTTQLLGINHCNYVKYIVLWGGKVGQSTFGCPKCPKTGQKWQFLDVFRKMDFLKVIFLYFFCITRIYYSSFVGHNTQNSQQMPNKYIQLNFNFDPKWNCPSSNT